MQSNKANYTNQILSTLKPTTNPKPTKHNNANTNMLTQKQSSSKSTNQQAKPTNTNAKQWEHQN